MASFFINPFYRRNQDRITKEFSEREFTNIYSHFRHKFAEQINKPTAENNDIINYDLKCRNYLILTNGCNMIISAITTLSFKTALGTPYIDPWIHQKLGHSKANWAQVVLYFGMFIYGQMWLAR